MSGALRKRRTRVGPNLYRSRTGVFEAGLTIDGRWTMRTLKAKTKRQAELELAQMKIDVAAPASVEQASLTFSQVAAASMEKFALLVENGERSARTLDHYQSTLRNHVIASFGHRPIGSIRADDIVDLYDSLRREGRSPYVLRGVTDVLSRVFKHAVRRDLIPQNPVERLERGERPRVRRREQRIVTHGEISALLATTDLEARDLLASHVFTGLRQGELLGLRWDDINHEGGLIHVRRQLRRPRNGRAAELGELKSAAGRRDVVLLPQLGSLLKSRRDRVLFAADSDFVFSSSTGSHTHYSRINRLIKRVAREQGVTPFRVHDLRHAFVSNLIVELGANPVVVRDQAGHSRTSVTVDVYAHLFDRARHAQGLRDSMHESAFGRLLGPRQDS